MGTGVFQWEPHLISYPSFVSSSTIKGSPCFLDQETLIVYYWLVPGMYLSIVCLILEYFVIISISENGIFYFHNGLIGYIVYFRVYRVFRVYCVF